MAMATMFSSGRSRSTRREPPTIVYPYQTVYDMLVAGKCKKGGLVCKTSKCLNHNIHFPVLTSFMIYHRFVTRLTRRVSLVEQKLPTLPEHLSSPTFLVGFVLLDL
jgi:hypothetical protein